jgi:4-hydroxy-3-methylbut-2-enyl diphosphate reductase
MAEIITAKTAGFCFGVRRAVSLAEKAASENKSCVCLGPLIHNNDVVKRLESLGVRTINGTSEIQEGDAVIIRSHGVSKSVYDAIKEKKASVIDATCPMVEKVHELAKNESGEGRLIIIIGHRAHPEVEAIMGWCDRSLVFENPEETEKYLENHPELYNIPVTVVSQTTAEREYFELNVKIIKKRCTNCKIFDTICNATSKRQEEAFKLANECDGMVVIGGKHSANSQNLANICQKNCSNVQFIENMDELDVNKFQSSRLIGITAGASTPEWIIKEVNRKMSDEIKTAVEETAENNQETEASFEELLERSIKTLHTGEKVSGIIASITQTEVSVDLGTKQSGYIPVSELTDEPGVNVNDIVKVGDEIEAYVMRVNDVEGTVMLSKKRLDSVKAWDDIATARNEKTAVEGTVVEENKGGIVVSVKGVRVFVPASQSGLPKDAPMSELLKKKVKLRITEVNQPRRRVVGSIRAVAFEERKARAEAVWNEIEVGKHYNGTVKSLTSYGAFVDIGGVDGMVHVSELSWGRIHQPSDVVKVGDEIDVYVISFDKETKKISLGHKDPNGNPWTKFTTTYSEGDEVEVKIVKLMTFGAFAEIIPGVDGLIHISQIADRRIGKPEDVLSEGQTVNVKIVGIDNENKKVSLSIRALTAPAAAPVEEQETEEEEVSGEESAVVYDTDNPPVDAE